MEVPSSLLQEGALAGQDGAEWFTNSKGGVLFLYSGNSCSSLMGHCRLICILLQLLGTGVGITIAMPAFTDTAMRTIGLENDRSVRRSLSPLRMIEVLTSLGQEWLPQFNASS